MLRVLRGLWRPLRGRATLCCEDSLHCIMFLPQKPYLTSGSLVDQVCVFMCVCGGGGVLSGRVCICLKFLCR